MKSNYKKILLEIICILYALLFSYAAASKLLDVQQFRIQLGQSPLLSAYADWIAWAVPLVEIIISILLFVNIFRIVGLYAAYFLMVMFTTYIVIILNFSDYVPCSCGGVLEKLGWTEHLIFNIAFIVLAFIGIMISGNQKNFSFQKNHSTQKKYVAI